MVLVQTLFCNFVINLYADNNIFDVVENNKTYLMQGRNHYNVGPFLVREYS